MQSIKERIENELINNRTHQSLDLISDYLKKNGWSDFSAGVVLIKSNLNRLNSEKNTGQITNEEFGRRITQIHSSILNLLQRIVSKSSAPVKGLVLTAPIQEKTEEKQIAIQSSRDKTKYLFNGKKLGKGKLVFEVVSEYLKQNPNSTFEHLLAKFPPGLQGSTGVINTVEYINEKYKNSLSQRHFMKESEILTSFDNIDFAISTEWGIGNIHRILELAKKEHYRIEEEKC